MLMLCFAVAKELGMTVSRLLQEATEEELVGWSCFLQIQAEQQKATMQRARRR
jgi:hypothetical protein